MLELKRLGEKLHRLSSAFAVGGGAVLIALVVLVVASIFGRAVFSRPVPGDFEIVAVGTAIAVFLFLPYCYLQRGNVAVDIFISRMPRRVQCVMDVIAASLFGVIAGLFAWRTVYGFADTLGNRDISMILGFPLWLAYPFGVASFTLLAVSCLYTALETVSGFSDE